MLKQSAIDPKNNGTSGRGAVVSYAAGNGARPRDVPAARVQRGGGQNWNRRGDFFAAAAQAMRRLLIDNARRRDADKHAGG